MNYQYGYDGIEYDYCAEYTSDIKYTGTHVDKYIQDKQRDELVVIQTKKEMERRRQMVGRVFVENGDLSAII